MGDETTPQGAGESKALADMTKKELLDVIAELEGGLATAQKQALEFEAALNGVLDDSIPLADAPPVRVVLARDLPREDIVDEVGSVVAVVYLAAGWDLNVLVDSVRNGFAREDVDS